MKRRIIFILLILSVLISVSCKTAPQEMSNQPSDALSLWTDEAPLKKMLTEYMGKITDEKSKDFIPVENRIAVFDMDGTLLCETDRDYFDHTLLAYRVTEDSSYKNSASAFEKEVRQQEM